jgi:hypothetical protein
LDESGLPVLLGINPDVIEALPKRFRNLSYASIARGSKGTIFTSLLSLLLLLKEFEPEKLSRK